MIRAAELPGNPAGLEETRRAPVSTEWTVPFGPSYFHLGLHNLPPAEADSLIRELNRLMRDPSEARRNELLAAIAASPEALVVLNHPLWDQGGVGAEAHAALLRRLLDSSGEFIHAIELNGLRPWEENQQVIGLAKDLGRTLVSGGDRHGCEPASAVNLTAASSFGEFAGEVRAGVSEVVLMRHYREPVRFRLLKSVFDIMRNYPDLPGREHWTDRVLCLRYTGEMCSLSQLWSGKPPAIIRHFEKAVRLAGGSELRGLTHACFAGGGREHDF